MERTGAFNSKFSGWAFDDEVENTSETLNETRYCSSIQSSSENENFSEEDSTQTGCIMGNCLSNNIFESVPEHTDISNQLMIEKNKLYCERANYTFSLGTNELICDQVTGSSFHSFNIRNIFKYVTLGNCISSEYIDELNDYVKQVLETNFIDTTKFYKYNNMYTSFSGVKYYRTELCIPECYYGYVAKACLEWSLRNPEKLIC